MRQNDEIFSRFLRFFFIKKKGGEGVVTVVNTTTPRYVETQRPTGRTPRPWLPVAAVTPVTPCAVAPRKGCNSTERLGAIDKCL